MLQAWWFKTLLRFSMDSKQLCCCCYCCLSQTAGEKWQWPMEGFWTPPCPSEGQTWKVLSTNPSTPMPRQQNQTSSGGRSRQTRQCQALNASLSYWSMRWPRGLPSRWERTGPPNVVVPLSPKHNVSIAAHDTIVARRIWPVPPPFSSFLAHLPHSLQVNLRIHKSSLPLAVRSTGIEKHRPSMCSTQGNNQRFISD